MFEKFKSMTLAEKKEKFMQIKPYLIVLVIPIAFTLLLGEMFSPIFVENIPIAMYDMDQSAASRKVVAQFYDSPVLSITEDFSSVEEIKEKLLLGEIHGAILLPKDFGKDLNGKKGAKAVVFMDNTNFMYGNNVMSAVNTIFETVNAGVQMKYLEGSSLVPYQAEQSVYTLNLVDRVLYNPQVGYFYYLFPGLLSIFVQQAFLAASVPILVEEKNRLRYLPMELSREVIKVKMDLTIRRFLLITGFSIISTLACIKIAMAITGFPMRGNILVLILFQIVFLGAVTGMALVIASLFEQVAHAVQFTMFLTIPTFLACGFAWPEYMMAPGFAAVMKAVWPLYYYIIPVKDIMLKGADLALLMPYLTGGIIFAAFWIPIGLLLFGRKIKLIRMLHQ
ncbi:ABC transporter permease [Clostridium aminobutyricum]|uniref:ABC transporter permease n=1 Tax=Clostridium aminobutyricum TaxID=33953 RepID=A0A939D8S9_CLOAM|nr:ABC transporter permease [Clostridium aminobutyricum]MBN7773220.1 ABC transporter permease [Clostridium aminobutyricum]